MSWCIPHTIDQDKNTIEYILDIVSRPKKPPTGFWVVFGYFVFIIRKNS
jgi:hypothetical protein